jgi:hypothetical protein
MYTLNYGFDSQLKADSPLDSPRIAEFWVIPVDSVDSGRNQWGNEKYWLEVKRRQIQKCDKSFVLPNITNSILLLTSFTCPQLRRNTRFVLV